MATVEKRGKGYRITVAAGIDLSGKQIRHRMVWTPDGKMTARQVEKELTRQVVQFEERVKTGAVAANGNIRFIDFAERYMTDYGRIYLKPTTRQNYARDLVRINQAIGHIRLKDLSTSHIQAFYKNLQEDGVRRHITATTSPVLQEWLKQNQISQTEFSKKAGVSRQTIGQALRGGRIHLKSAEKIAAAANAELNVMFTVHIDDRPLASSTVHAYHRTLSAILEKAVKWRCIPRNPADHVDLPSVGIHKARYLDEPDARRMLQLLQDEPIKWRAPIIFDLLSGLRRAELLGLRWSDIDWDNHVVRIARTSNYVPGEGVYLGTPKTEDSVRFLKVSRTAILLLLEYRRWQDALRDSIGDAWEASPGDERIFTNEVGRPLFPTSLTQWMGRFIKRSGLPSSCIHSLRHTYASLLIADGTPLVVVSENLGHAQVSTTNDIYSHVIASAEAKAAQVLDRFAEDIHPKITPRAEKTKFS